MYDITHDKDGIACVAVVRGLSPKLQCAVLVETYLQECMYGTWGTRQFDVPNEKQATCHGLPVDHSCLPPPSAPI